MTLERLEELSRFPEYTGPHLHNPDANPYYSFLLYLAADLRREMDRPIRILEIGTDKGDSACHMACGAPDSEVLTIDQADSPTVHERISHFPNITFWCRNVNEVPGLPNDLASRVPFDLFFQDGEHSGSQVSGEMAWYWPLVRPGGIIVMDDISLKDCGIREVWDSITHPKIELPHLHKTGFGVVIKP